MPRTKLLEGNLKKRVRSSRTRPGGPGGNGGHVVSDYDRALEPRRATKITRLEFEKFLIREYGFTGEKAREIWADIRRLIREALAEGVPVNLTDVGTLEPYLKKAAKYRHPGTGKIEKTPERRHVRFLISPSLRKVLHTD